MSSPYYCEVWRGRAPCKPLACLLHLSSTARWAVLGCRQLPRSLLQTTRLCTPRVPQATSIKAPASLARLDTYALAGAQPKLTGLPMVVYISECWSAKTGRHAPKLYVSQSYSAAVWSNAVFSVTVERDVHVLGERGEICGRDVGLVVEFIELNMPLLLAYWRQDPVVGTLEMLQALRRVEV